MGYTTVSQMITLFGANEMAGWSGQDNTPVCSGEAFSLATQDEPEWPDYISDDEQTVALTSITICQNAINVASIEMDSYLQSVYNLPLSDPVIQASMLPTVCANIARSYLADGLETKDVNDRAKLARLWLKELTQGIVTIPSAGDYGGVTLMPAMAPCSDTRYFRHTRIL